MPATITSQFRKNNALALVAKAKPITATASGGVITYGSAEIANTPLWIGIGKTDSWPTVSGNIIPKTPNSSLADSNAVLANLITLNQVIAAELMFPANLWQSGRTYKVYDSGDDACFYATTLGSTTYYPCYINLTNDMIYLCVRSSGGVSNITPAGSTAGVITPALTSSSTDGYYWAYLYTLAGGEPGKLNTSTFKPLTTLTNDSATQPKGIFLYAQPIDATTGVSIPLNLANVTAIMLHWTGTYKPIASGSAAYTSGGAISIFNTLPTNRLDYATIDQIDSAGTRIISYASITVTMQTGHSAIAFRPVITAADGIVSDLTKVLPCWYAGFIAEFNGADENAIDLIKTNNYSQISLINNPQNTNGAITPINSKNCLRYFTLSSFIGFGATAAEMKAHEDKLIYQCNSAGAITANGAIGIIDYVIIDSASVKRVYFLQNSDVKSGSNMNMFTVPSYINIGNITSNATVWQYSAIVEPEYKRGTGEVLFLENRSEIYRANNQSEVIKIIIQL